LSELASCLDRLATTDECAAIDLRSLPLSPDDRMELQHLLGNGEVTATLHAEGESTLRETAFSGIWWVEHRSRDGDLVADLLEVTRVPAILASAPDEISTAAEHLNLRIRQTNSTGIRVSRQ
jgi:hydrogenase-1 operon protein HyaF